MFVYHRGIIVKVLRNKEKEKLLCFTDTKNTNHN